jgi:hypothetical protein
MHASFPRLTSRCSHVGAHSLPHLSRSIPSPPAPSSRPASHTTTPSSLSAAAAPNFPLLRPPSPSTPSAAHGRQPPTHHHSPAPAAAKAASPPFGGVRSQPRYDVPHADEHSLDASPPPPASSSSSMYMAGQTVSLSARLLSAVAALEKLSKYPRGSRCDAPAIASLLLWRVTRVQLRSRRGKGGQGLSSCVLRNAHRRVCRGVGRALRS